MIDDNDPKICATCKHFDNSIGYCSKKYEYLHFYEDACKSYRYWLSKPRTKRRKKEHKQLKLFEESEK